MDTATIISGALLSQVLIGVILFCASSIIEVYQPRTSVLRDEPRPVNLGLQLLALVLGSLIILVFTQEQSSSWLGLFKGSNFEGISRDIAMPLVFAIDIIIAAMIVYRTGGSIHSPFQPIFLLIPTLAVLLYEPTPRVVVYALVVAAVFLIFMFQTSFSRITDRLSGRVAYGFVSIACLALAVTVGLLTRTCPESIC